MKFLYINVYQYKSLQICALTLSCKKLKKKVTNMFFALLISSFIIPSKKSTFIIFGFLLYF